MLSGQRYSHDWKSDANMLSCLVYDFHDEIVEFFFVGEENVGFYVFVDSVPQEDWFVQAAAAYILYVGIVHQRVDFAVADYVPFQVILNLSDAYRRDSIQRLRMLLNNVWELAMK